MASGMGKTGEQEAGPVWAACQPGLEIKDSGTHTDGRP